MKNPELIIYTDDDKSMSSELHITVNKLLNRIILHHQKQYGQPEMIQLFPDDVDELCDYLQKCKAWIASGYEEKLKP